MGGEREAASQKAHLLCVWSVLRQSHARCIRPTSFVSLKTILRVIHNDKMATTAREHIIPVSIAFFPIFILKERKRSFLSISTHFLKLSPGETDKHGLSV